MATPEGIGEGISLNNELIAQQQYLEGGALWDARKILYRHVKDPVKYYLRELLAIEMVPLPGEERLIADLGCSSGDELGQAINKLPETTKYPFMSSIIGIDPFPKAYLDRVADKDKPPLPDNFIYRQGRAEDIPAEDNTFSALMANFMLYTVSDLDKALSEIQRVVKPNGLILITTNGRENMILRHLMERDLARVAAKDIGIPVVLPQTPGLPFFAEDAQDILERAGYLVPGWWPKKQIVTIPPSDLPEVEAAIITAKEYVVLDEKYRNDPYIMAAKDEAWRRNARPVINSMLEILEFSINQQRDETPASEKPAFRDWADRQLFYCLNTPLLDQSELHFSKFWSARAGKST